MAKEPIVVESLNLTPNQERRCIAALAVFDARVAAHKAGMSLTEVQSQTWLVDVDGFQIEL
jgi:hypothetical protein